MTAKRNSNTEVLMIKRALYAAIGFAAIASIASLAMSISLAGEDREDLSSATAVLPSGTFTTSAHSDEWKIAKCGPRQHYGPRNGDRLARASEGRNVSWQGASPR